MRFRKPSPAMGVAIAALAMATTGSAVAAVDFARNAGAVDGLSAVGASSSVNRATGRLVATARGGSHKGQIPAKFLANVPFSTTFERGLEVVDNANGAAQTVSATPLGSLSVACNDQNGNAGNEDPATTVTFASTAPGGINLARTVGGGAPTVVGLAPGTQHSFVINGSNTFRLQLEAGGVAVVYDGQVRQDGRGTAAGFCVIAGTAQTFTP